MRKSYVMSLTEVYDNLAAGINPRKQFIAIHRGRVNAEGALIEPQRTDPETGLPLLCVFLRTNMDDIRWAGWEEFTPPPAPREVRQAETSSRSRKK